MAQKNHCLNYEFVVRLKNKLNALVKVRMKHQKVLRRLDSCSVPADLIGIEY